MIVYGARRRKIALATGTYARLEQKWDFEKLIEQK